MSEQEYRDKLAEYERRMGIGESDPVKDGYLVMVNILRQQNSYLTNVKIDQLIVSEANAKEFERAKGLWEKLPTIIENVTNLKIALKMEGEDKKSVTKPFSAKDVANGEI